MTCKPHFRVLPKKPNWPRLKTINDNPSFLVVHKNCYVRVHCTVNGMEYGHTFFPWNSDTRVCMIMTFSVIQPKNLTPSKQQYR